MAATQPGQLAYTSAGSGDTVLLLVHGFPLTSKMWERQVEALASEEVRMLTPDLPGFGATPGAMTTPEECADLLEAMIAESGARRVVIAGFSMGGYIALAFARKHASRLRGLVLIDTKAEADTDEVKKGRRAMAERARTEGADAIVEAMLPRLLAEATLRDRQDVVRQARDAAQGATVDGIVGALNAMAARPPSVDLLPRITVPALVIVGRDDVITPVADAERMASAIPDAKLVVIDGAGHTTPLEQPDAVNRAIRDWLAALP